MNTSKLNARFFDGKQSISRTVTLSLDDNHILSCEPRLFEPQALASLKISARLDNTSPRQIHFPDDSILAISDHLTFDTWLKRVGVRKKWGEKLASNYGYFLACLFFIILFFVWIFVEGIPRLSRSIVFSVSDELNELITSDVMNGLDENFFNPSKLDNTRSKEIETQFKRLISPEKSSFNFKLIFRDGSDLVGANAFALPNGTIIVTDQLIQLLNHDDQINSILLHEIGHVVKRHGLQSMINYSIFSIFILFFGDVSSSHSMISIASTLFKNGYSRIMETEADDYALKQMLARNIRPKHFADVMFRLSYCDSLNEKLICPEAYNNNTYDLLINDKNNTPQFLHYLSTHPAIGSRIKKFIQEDKILNHNQPDHFESSISR